MKINTFTLLIIILFIAAGCTSKSDFPQEAETQILDCVALDIQKLSRKEKNTSKVWKALDQHHKNAESRNLIIFQDGTGNTHKTNTNIWQMYNFAVNNSCSQPDVPYYRRGLGTSVGNLLLGKLTGSGIDHSIREGYKFLVETYQPGDKIFLFGFSRGAYIARSLNGMLEYVGLLNKDRLVGKSAEERGEIVDDLYAFYNHLNDGEPRFSERLYSIIADKIKVKYGDLPLYTHENKVVATAIGVFDTVPALGIGRDDFPDNHRTELCATEGYHALAIDEQRNDFRPLRFNDQVKPEQHLDEVWFAGAHADVGGGYDSKGLESIARQWMLKKFAKFNLFPGEKRSCNTYDAVCEGGELHDEFLVQPLFKTFGLHWRKPACSDTVHASVLCRLNIEALPKPNQEKEPQGRYQPENIYPCLKSSYNFVPKNYRCSNGQDPLAMIEQKATCSGPCRISKNECN